MRNRIGMLGILLGSTMMLGCETGIGDGTDIPSTPVPRHEFPFTQFSEDAAAQLQISSPWKRAWSQYQGDPAGSGFLAVETNEIGELRWRRSIGQVINSSPVIGPDGTIYVGTAAGELIAVTPFGQERWRRDFFPDAVIMSTPAVAADGSIFVVYQQRDDEGEMVSTLNRVSTDGRWLWATYVGDTTASPKVLGEHVYLSTRMPGPQLMVFDFDANVVATARTTQCTPICGSGIDFGSIWDTAVNIADWACNCSPFILTLYCVPAHFDGFGCEFQAGGTLPMDVQIDPSVAVTDMPELAPDGNPLVVVANGFCMSAYRFHGSALEFLWQRDIYGNGCDFDPVQHTSPAIFADGRLVIGNVKGDVKAFDPLTGDRLWTYDAGEPVRAPASAIGAWTYVVSENYLHAIDEDGEQISAMRLTAESRNAPALSASYVYAVTSETVHSVDFGLDSRVVDHRISGGASTPAISADNRVYVVTLDGVLVAYGPSNAPPGTVGNLGGSTGDIAAP